MAYSNLFFQAFIYLLAAITVVPFAKKLGLGSVLGYLFAGIIIGPFVLGIVGQHTQDVMQFAEFGVVMMLFLVGLELRPAMLWELRMPLLLAGSMQVILTTLAISGVALCFGLHIAAAITIGMIFASSSTAIVLQIIKEKNWSNTEAGKTVFAILLFQDIAVIPMLAIFPLLSNDIVASNNHNLSGIKQTLVIMAVIIGIIAIGRFLIRPIFRFIAGTKLREAFTAAALVIVIGIALATDAVGLSPALGTFLGGVVLAESEYRHELESDIEPFKGLLLGLFFISVGASINFPLIEKNFILIISLVLLLISVKFIVLTFLGKVLRKGLRDNLLIAMSLAQGGEFCFVLLSYALQQHILAQALVNELVAVVALSMLLTPLIIIVYERLIEPRFINRTINRQSDLTDQQNHPVIIAGFGRFGQVIGRLLLANGFKTTVLEIDENQIDTLRKFGLKAFYGDAGRMDLLETAGLSSAKLFIIAIDDTNRALAIARNVQQAHPKLRVLIRVRGRTELYDALGDGFGFNDLYRETFDSALLMARDALNILGVSETKAARATKIFKQLDEESIINLAPLYRAKDKDFAASVIQSRKNLEDIMATDQENFEK